MLGTRSALVWLLGLAAACGPTLGTPPAAPPGDGPAAALAALARWSRTPWRVRYDPALGTAAFLAGRSAPLGSPAALGTAARAFLLRFPALFGLLPDEELGHGYSHLDGLGMRHVRFHQARARVPVWGSSLTVHLDPQGAVVRVSGRVVPLPPLGREALYPRVSAEAARQLALGWVQGERPEASLSASAPALWILPLGGDAALAWRTEVEGQEEQLPLLREVFIDAVRGTPLRQADLLARLNLAVPATGSGVGALGDRRALSLTQRGDLFYLEDPRRGRQRTTVMRPGERLPGHSVTSKEADRWDEAAAVDVHAHLATLWDYFARAHNHFGWDGRGRGVVAVARAGDPRVVALFDGRRLLFGDGDGAELLPPGAALDVVAHEYAHAVVRALAGLRSEGESGALEEGIADLFACLAEGAQAPGGPDWTVGERVYRPGGQAAPLRDLRDPRRTDQVRSLGDLAEGLPEAEKGAGGPAWVRRYAGIASHAGYQVAIRIGAERAAAIWYRAIATYLHQFARFSDAADATLAAAQDLHGQDEEVLRAVREAWRQVGVGNIETIGESARP